MAGKINIATVDIDLELVSSKAAEVRKRLEGMAVEVKTLKEGFKRGSVGIDEYTKEMTRLVTSQREAQRDLRTYDGVLQAHIATSKNDMATNKVLTGSIRELSAALSQNKKVYSEMTASQRDGAAGKELLEIIQQQDKAYKELQKSIGNNQVEVGNYKKAILEAIGDSDLFGTSINNISASFNSMKQNVVTIIAPITNYIITGKMAAKTASETASAMEATTKATNRTSVGMRLLRGAIISTGIGALVVVLGSLVSYFTSTQEGIDKVNRVLTPLKVIFQSFIGVIQDFGRSVLEAFKNPKRLIQDLGTLIKDQIINRLTSVVEMFKGVGKVLTGDFKEGFKQMGNAALQSVTGVRNVIDKMGNSVGKVVSEAVRRGQEIEAIDQRLSASEAEFIERTARLKEEFKAQNKIAEDTTKSFEERAAAARKSIEVQMSINALAKERNDLEVRLIELKQQSNDTSDKDRAELAKKRAELMEKNAAMLEAVTTQNNKVNTIEKAAAEEAKKRAEEAKKMALERLKEDVAMQRQQVEVYVATNSGVAKSLEERLAIEERGMQDRLKLLERERKAGLLKQYEYERQREEVTLAYAKVRADLSIEAVKRELAAYETEVNGRIEAESKITVAMIDEEQARQQALYDKRVEALEREKALKMEIRQWDYVAEEEHQRALLSLKTDFDEQVAESDKQRVEVARQERRTQQEQEFQERLLTLQERGAMQWDIETEQARQAHEKQLLELEEVFNEGELSKAEYEQRLLNLTRERAMKERELEQKKNASVAEMALGALGQAKQLFAEHTAAGKAAAIAEAMINTYLAITKTLSAYPYPMNAIMAAATGATGMLNVSKIAATSTKFADGGLVVGKSHAAGGVPFSVRGRDGYEMEGGEYVVNKRATAAFFPVLEAINRSTAKGMSYNPVYMAAGGIIKQAHSQTEYKEIKIDFEQMAKAIERGAMQGTLQGSQQGTYEGARVGSLEGAMQGALEGTSIGAQSGLTEGAMRIADNEILKRSASI